MELLVGFWNKLCKDGERTQINYRKQDRIYRDRAYEILVIQPYSFLSVPPGEKSLFIFGSVALNIGHHLANICRVVETFSTT